ncbi:MAG TPA: enoyl-CoA hydratase-related protein [Bacilli bacterium]
MGAATPLVTYERYGNGVVVLTLNNPPLNLITLDMTAQMIAMMDRLEDDPEARAVVIRGSGSKAFCAGADIKEFTAVRDQVVEKKLAKENEAWSRIERLSKPVIAAMEGVVLGGGCEIALACDLRVMSATGRIGLPEINLGVFPGSGGLFRLSELIGPSRAKELLYLGEPIDAQEALKIGLINRIAPEGETLQAAVALAEKIAAKSATAIAMIKSGVKKSLGMSRADAVALSLELSDAVFRTDDCAEGISAFFEKRTPIFNKSKGRG